MKDLLSIATTEPAELSELVDLTLGMKTRAESYGAALTGRSVGLFFMKPSTRTRVSCEVGAHQLGAQAVVLRNDEVGLGERESAADVARVLDRYLDLVALRVFDHADLVTMAEHADIPVVNLLSDLEHPCQALADVATIAEHKPVSDAVVAYVGDGNNVAHSLAAAVTALGGSMRVAAPEGYEPASQYSVGVTVTNDPAEAVAGADVVYTDVWTSMGQEQQAGARLTDFNRFTVDEALFGHAADDAIFLHCLPAHRGQEVTDGVMDHPRSRVFDQAENRLHAFKAVLVHLLA